MKVSISDHAVIRWLERQYGIDIDSYRAELAALLQPQIDMGVHRPKVGDLFAIIDAGSGVVKTITLRPENRRGGESFVDYGDATLNWKALSRKRPHR